MTEIEQKYQTLSTEKLLEILKNKSDYRRDAIDAAENELSLRSLSQEEVESKEKTLALWAAQKVARATEGLSWQEKVGMLLLSCCGLGLIPWLSSNYLLRREGYKQKADQLAIWMGVGYGIFFLMISLMKWVFGIL